MFVAVFAMLSLFYSIGAAIIGSLAIPSVLVVFDSLSTLFCLIGGIALATHMGVHTCGNTDMLFATPPRMARLIDIRDVTRNRLYVLSCSFDLQPGQSRCFSWCFHRVVIPVACVSGPEKPE